MTTNTPQTEFRTGNDGRELVIERVFDAPRELVFRAWTEPEHIKRWFGPSVFPVTYCVIDLRPGGTWHYCMTGPDNTQAWGKATYQEVVAPERLVYTDAFSDAEGNVNETLPVSTITVNFIDEGGKTRINSRAVYANAADLQTLQEMGMFEGITETWQQLADYLPTVDR